MGSSEQITGTYRFNESLDLRSFINMQVMAAVGTFVLKAGVTGDTDPRFIQKADGVLQWGPGNAGVDTTLSRTAVSELTTQGAFKIDGALTTEHDFIVPVLRELLGSQADNVNMVGKTIYYVDATGAQNISGFAGGKAGKIIAVVNRDATDTITLLHASGSSSAGNRLVFAGDANLALSTREAILLFYNTTDNDWRPLSGGTP